MSHDPDEIRKAIRDGVQEAIHKNNSGGIGREIAKNLIKYIVAPLVLGGAVIFGSYHAIRYGISETKRVAFETVSNGLKTADDARKSSWDFVTRKYNNALDKLPEAPELPNPKDYIPDRHTPGKYWNKGIDALPEAPNVSEYVPDSQTPGKLIGKVRNGIGSFWGDEAPVTELPEGHAIAVIYNKTGTANDVSVSHAPELSDAKAAAKKDCNAKEGAKLSGACEQYVGLPENNLGCIFYANVSGLDKPATVATSSYGTDKDAINESAIKFARSVAKAYTASEDAVQVIKICNHDKFTPPALTAR